LWRGGVGFRLTLISGLGVCFIVCSAFGGWLSILVMFFVLAFGGVKLFV
jgi:hypothetical protein